MAALEMSRFSQFSEVKLEATLISTFLFISPTHLQEAIVMDIAQSPNTLPQTAANFTFKQFCWLSAFSLKS